MTLARPCKLGLMVPEHLHQNMVRCAAISPRPRGALQRAYTAALQSLLDAVGDREVIAFTRVRTLKICLTVRTPESLRLDVRACLAVRSLKLTDFACAAVEPWLGALEETDRA